MQSFLKVKYFQFEFGIYYIILVDIENRTCLWTTSFPPFHFVRKACYDSETTDSMKLNFYINRKLEGALLMNHPLENREMKTFTSTNDGRFWFKVKFVRPVGLKPKESVYFDFRLHDPQSVPDNFQWIDIQYEHSGNALQPFITLDGGQIWKAIPQTHSKVVMLNFGTVILLVYVNSNRIIYSFDETATWLGHDVFQNKPTILYIGRVSDSDLKALIVTSEPGVNNLKFTILDFSPIFKFRCDVKHYRQWQFNRHGGYCYRGNNIVISTRNQTIRCVDHLKNHMNVKSACHCTSDDYSCVFNYHSFNDICVIDPQAGITEEPYNCDSKSRYDFYQMGYVRMAHDSCDPHELHLDTNVTASDLCVEHEWTNFLFLFKSKRLFISQLMSDGGHFRKPVSIQVELFLKIDVSAPITYDISQQRIYNFLGNYITQFQTSGIEKAMLYFKKNTMVFMELDPVLSVIIFLNVRKQLRILSLITHFEYLISYDVTGFKYSSYYKIISFVKSKNTFCYCKVFEKPTCTKQKKDILQFYIDLTALKAYFLTSQNDLIIKTFVDTPESLETLKVIPNVSDFSVYDDHLYLLEGKKLMYRNVKQQNKSMLLLNDKFDRLWLHRGTLQSFKHACENLNCQFMCCPTSNNEVECACPLHTKQIDNRCECPPGRPHCMLAYCSGFFCKNSKCLLNNVRCNGVDDCGDASDEAGCSKKCLPTSHMCKNKCISKETVCDAVEVMIGIATKSRRLRGLHIFLIILLCFVVPYPLYLLLRLCYRKLYYRRLRLEYWSHPNYQSSDLETLIEPKMSKTTRIIRS
ncbi:Sortilin-related receptor [Thelohanellus kitauei]|uniref:Sortilin-related receptor n=1 Tax=Thelohanellus kitauei TaxID=669202 RepID=A0A0C2MJE3_THEKT|nr:Sortilin-related receptor [Thelohanellus kitauei]